MTYGVIAVIGVAVYVANDGRSTYSVLETRSMLDDSVFKDSTPQYSYQAVLMSVRGNTA